MALNDLEVDTVGGADTNGGTTAGSALASGAGAVTDGTSTIDLSADSPDLSGVVAGDGIPIGNRNDGIRGTNMFEVLTVNDGADTMTVTPSPGAASGQAWAVGGAWKTLARQALVVEAGDKVFIKNSATYNENLVISIAGTSTAPIVLEGYGSTRGDGVRFTIDGQSSRASGITQSLGSASLHYTIKNSRITGHTSSGITFGTSGDQLTLDNVRCDNNGGSGVLGDNSFRITDSQFDNNTLHGIDLDLSVSLIGSRLQDNTQNGANVKTGTFYCNEFTGNGGVQLFCANGSNTIISNTIDGVDKTGFGIDLSSTGIEGLARIINNSISRCSVGIEINESNGDQQVGRANNLFDNTTDYNANWPTEARATDTTFDPSYEDQGTGDYRLSSVSLLLGAGYDIGKPINDESFMDIGAHQMKAADAFVSIESGF